MTVSPDDTLDTAYKRMRVADVSQLPVLDNERLIGIIDESDILDAIESGDRAKVFARHVSSAMTAKLNTLQSTEHLDALIPVFERDEVAIVLSRQGVPRPDHARRSDQPFEARGMSDQLAPTAPIPTASPSPRAPSTGARILTR